MRSVIRQRYKLGRVLSEDETELLLLLIGWRRGSVLVQNSAGVIGCSAHPDDFTDFLKELRKRRTPLKFEDEGNA